jgi:hypothetical protein
MKYFTPVLLQGLASPNDDVADRAHEEWERALARWKRRWPKIKPAFPVAVQRFKESGLCLHDARVLSLAKNGETLVMVLEREPPAQDVVLLTFTLAEDPVIDTEAVSGHGDGRVVTWLYEEWDLDRRQRCWFEVLLSNGWSLRLCFTEFQYLVLPQILPARNGCAPFAATGVPRSA